MVNNSLETNFEATVASVGLASTRLVGYPHLGTFYGWIIPISEASKRDKIVLLLADLQSLDKGFLASSSQGESFQMLMRSFVSSKVEFIAESQIGNLVFLLPLLSRCTGLSALKRNPALRAIAESGYLTLGTLCFPLFMAADLIAVRPEWIFWDPRKSFRPHELPLHLARQLLDGDKYILHKKPFPEVFIPDNSGSRARRMYENQHSLTSNDLTDLSASLGLWLKGVDTPLEHEDRYQRCRTIRHIWAAASHEKTSRAACEVQDLSCVICKNNLLTLIEADLKFAINEAAKTKRPDSRANLYSKRVEDVLTTRVGARLLVNDEMQSPDVALIISEDLLASDFVLWLLYRLIVARGSDRQAGIFNSLIIIMPSSDSNRRNFSGADNSPLLKLAALLRDEKVFLKSCHYYEIPISQASLVNRMHKCLIPTLTNDTISFMSAAINRLIALEIESELAIPSVFVMNAPVPKSDLGPSSMDLWGVIEPVRRYIDLPFEAVIRRYPTARSWEQLEDRNSEFLDMAAISGFHSGRVKSDWLCPSTREIKTNFRDIKYSIIDSRNAIWGLV